MMDLILPCYIVNEEILQLTKNAIESFGKVNLIVIDNASPIGGGYLRSVARTYVFFSENRGYAKAVNMGLKLAGSDLVAVANNDVIVSPNWQEVAQEIFKEYGTYSCHFRMTDYGIPFEYGSEISYEGKERWCTSSFFVINTKARLLRFSPVIYDENFFNSYDDWDYWMRIRAHGYKTCYTNKACYQHHHSSTQKLIPEREANNQKNREYFKHKWGAYPEDMFAEKYPDQMKQEYWKGFQI